MRLYPYQSKQYNQNNTDSSTPYKTAAKNIAQEYLAREIHNGIAKGHCKRPSLKATMNDRRKRPSHKAIATLEAIAQGHHKGTAQRHRIRVLKDRFGLWWRRLLDFLSRPDGGSCPNKQNRGRRNAISIYILVANSFNLDRAFFDTKLLFGNAKFLSNRASLATVFFLEFCPCKEELKPGLTVQLLRQNNKRINHEKTHKGIAQGHCTRVLHKDIA